MPSTDKSKRSEYIKKYKSVNRERISKYNTDYRLKNASTLNENSRKARLKLRMDAFAAYGGNKCCWCHEDDAVVLTIDHVNNNGNKHIDRAGYRMGGNRLYTWLRLNNYPIGFQVLCCNCNFAKSVNGGVLPEHRHNLHLKVLMTPPGE